MQNSERKEKSKDRYELRERQEVGISKIIADLKALPK